MPISSQTQYDTAAKEKNKSDYCLFDDLTDSENNFLKFFSTIACLDFFLHCK